MALPTLPSPPEGASDPLVRYTAAGVVAVYALGSIVVVIHGYWVDPNYHVPDIISVTLGLILSACLTLLGFNQGSASSAHASAQGAALASNNSGPNGGTHDAGPATP